jgi:signal transduction histidine kinase
VVSPTGSSRIIGEVGIGTGHLSMVVGEHANGDGAATKCARCDERRSGTEAMTPRRVALRRRGIWLICTALIAVTIISAGLLVWDMRVRTVANDRREATTLGTVLAERTTRYMQVADRVLQELQSRIGSLNIQGPEDFQNRLGTPEIDDLLHDRMQNLPPSNGFILIDGLGRVASSSREINQKGVDVTGSDFVRYFVANDDPGVFISVARPSRINGRRTVFMARRLNARDGQLLGVAAAAIDVEDLSEFHRAVNTRPGQAVTLLRRDGIVLTRDPDPSNATGQKMPAVSPWYDLVQTGGGTYRSPGFLDVEPATISVHPLRGYPLVIDVAIREYLALASWRQEAALVGVAAICMVAALLVLFWMISRQMRGREQYAGRLRDFAELASDWFWEQDRDYRFTDIGLGSPLNNTGGRSNIGKRRWEVNDTSRDPERWEAHRQDVLNHRRFLDFRMNRIGKDGRVHHISVSGVPVHDRSGTFIGYRGTGRDITTEVNAAMELREARDRAEQAESLLRDAVDSMSEAFVIYDRDDRFVVCNEAYRRIYAEGRDLLEPGIRFEDIVRHVLSKGGNIDARGREEKWLAERLRYHQEAIGAIAHRMVDGSWVLATDRRMKNGGIAGLRIDITALKQAEMALHASERQLRAYAEMSSDWFWEQDADLRFLKDARIPLTSRPTDVGLTRWDLADPAMNQLRWEPHKADLAARRPFRDFRWERIGTDGKRRYLSTSGDPIFNEAGVFLGYHGTGRDVTADVEVAEELRVAKDVAEAANRSKSEFLANMGHELRTPLHAIIGFSELIHDVTIGRVAGDHVAWASDILASGRHLLNMINDILQLSTIDAGHYDLADDTVDLPAVVHACLRETRAQAETNQVNLESTLPIVNATLRADSRAVKKIVLNLVANAVKFTPAGGLVSVQIEYAANGDLALVVTDTGIGIDAAVLTSLCEPFTQADASISRKYGGTGLGLAISRKLMALHGGSLTIESTLGQGTTVRVVFPATRIMAKAPQPSTFARAST